MAENTEDKGVVYYFNRQTEKATGSQNQQTVSSL